MSCNCDALEAKLNQIINRLNQLERDNGLTEKDVRRIGNSAILEWLGAAGAGGLAVLGGVSTKTFNPFQVDVNGKLRIVDERTAALEQGKLDAAEARRRYAEQREVDRIANQLIDTRRDAINALTEAKAAKAEADKLERELGAVNDRAIEARKRAIEAENKANTAVNEAITARNTASQASLEAADAKFRAGQAQTSADRAGTRAIRADNKAGDALTEAGSALRSARSAIDTADTAVGTAQLAKAGADQAKNLANSATNQVRKVSKTAGDALNKAGKAISESSAAKSLAKIADSKAVRNGLRILDILGSIASILSLIDILFGIINSLSLRSRLNRIERRQDVTDRLIDRILGILSRLRPQVSRNSGDISSLNSAVNDLSNLASRNKRFIDLLRSQMSSALSQLANLAAGLAGAIALSRIANSIANRALNRATANSTQIQNNARNISRNSNNIRNNVRSINRNSNNININKGGINVNRNLIQNIRNITQNITQNITNVFPTRVIRETREIREVADLTPILRAVDRNNGNILNNGKVVRKNQSLLNTLLGLTGTINTLVNQTKDKLFKFAKWSGLQRVLSLLNTAVLLHNAMMLSRSITDTLAFGIDNVFNLFGVHLQDDEGDAISFSEFTGQIIQDAVNGLIGESNAEAITEKISQFNRIYHSAMNIVYTMTSIMDATRSILEVVGQYTGKIGNALKRSGTVLENSYNWMFEDITAFSTQSTRFQRLYRNIENVDTVAGSMAAVTGDLVSIQQEVGQLGNNRTELENAISDFDSESGARANNGFSYGSVPSAINIADKELEDKLDSEVPVTLDNPLIGAP